jgi:hypothetical protein
MAKPINKDPIPRRLWLAYFLGCTPGFRRASWYGLLLLLLLDRHRQSSPAFWRLATDHLVFPLFSFLALFACFLGRFQQEASEAHHVPGEASEQKKRSTGEAAAYRCGSAPSPFADI